MVSNELLGEKIDIVYYREDPIDYVREAMAPAKPKDVILDEESGTATVIVNDFSEVNVDAGLVAAGSHLTRGEDRFVELSNGCICCTLREDLVEGVGALARSGDYDQIVIESTGISEPMPVAATFEWEFDDGSRLADIAPIDTMVTLVDASLIGQMGVAHYDPLRIVLDVRGTGRTGYEIAEALRHS